MLRYLKISHLAIIDRVEVEFREGFNVLTGETGAGKSILIGALNLLLGAKAGADMIRTGEEEAEIEALFEIPDSVSLPGEVQVDVGGELILSRKILRSGRSRCSINGSLATLGMLQAVGRSIVSIFGQHEHQTLLDATAHLGILDRFGGLDDLRSEVSRAFAAWGASARSLDRAVASLQQLEHAGRENAAAALELTAAALKPGEEEQLLEERNRLKNAVQVREKAFEAYHSLYGRSGSLLESFGDVRKALEYLASTDEKLVHLRETLEDALYRIEDVALEVRDIAERAQSNPARLEQIEDRLTLIRRLKKKYGLDVPGLVDYLAAISEEEGNVLEARNLVKRLHAELDRNRSVYLDAARKLSTERRKAAVRLEGAMKKELSDLAMEQAELRVVFHDLGEGSFTADGMETAELYLAANPGEVARPLARIASGGELSRIMLSVKALQADSESACTVVFDEVDAGIGGRTAQAVGARLARVAERQQVLCITHLHQIAALADNHVSVTKHVENGRTRIRVTTLGREARVEELSRMLGASADSDAVREHVTRLMEQGLAEVSG
ncbi:MAG: DNA repair protein RecN [Thermodesulfobacteriota bacterium]